MAAAKRALITGSTTNLGLAIAKRLAADGFEVVLNYAEDTERARAALSLVQESCPSAQLIRADVTKAPDVSRLFRKASADGPIDVLINNVGRFLFKPFLETTQTEWDDILASNLLSAVLCCREVLPTMRGRGTGSIVNIGSMHADAIRATPNTLPYAIAKSGVVALTKSLAKTEGPHGIRVNAVCPGYVDTESGQNPAGIEDRIPLRRLARSEEIAAAVAFLASDEAAYVSGAILNAHGGALL
ncbi:SDR family oxidoreductase [Candidatus Bipolaricaulota bacterium]|nr:SDR family oxidoreductase [Candidatus Bipolaricaulota bacterium]